MKRPVFSLAVLFALAACGAKAQIAPPLALNRTFNEKVEGVQEMQPKDVADLETRLAANAEDETARVRLIVYYNLDDQADRPESKTRRIEAMQWLVEHHPDSDILTAGYGFLSYRDNTPDVRAIFDPLWDSALHFHRTDDRVFANAARFYFDRDPRLYALYAERAFELSPENVDYARALGTVYGLAISRTLTAGADADGSLARRGLAVLETTRNSALIEWAVQMMRSQVIKSVMFGMGVDTNTDAIAARLLDRAKLLDPGLKVSNIYPDMPPGVPSAPPPPVRAPTSTPAPGLGVRTASFAGLRMVASLYGNALLPPGVSAALRGRGCAMPEPGQAGPPRSSVRGEFVEKGVMSWAVLCGRDRSSSILVFHDEQDGQPEEIAQRRDEVRPAGGDSAGRYQREIGSADAKSIMDRYRTYGGSEPPPLDHAGIDDGFQEKASVVWYRYQGKWRQLTGSN